MTRRISIAALAFVSLPAIPVLAAEPATLWVVDDLGAPVTSPLEICWVDGLDRRCFELPPGERAPVPERFDFVTAEGARHGPARQPRRQLQHKQGEQFLLVVPRKALLQIRDLGEGPVMLSLYDANSPTFRHPIWRRRLIEREVAGEGLLIPAGRLLLSLTATGAAPDLHLLQPGPGDTVRIDHRRRSGWSVVLRTTARSSGTPAAGAKIQLQPMPGYGGTESWQLRTDTAGLAVASGISSPLLQGRIEHPDYVPRDLAGLTASPGSFGFEEISLSMGAHLEVLVSQNGEPVAGTRCRLRVPAISRLPGKADPVPPLDVSTTETDGRCGSARLPEGEYFLEVVPTDSPLYARWVQPLRLTEAETRTVEVALTPIHVAGEVMRGTRPAAGFKVRFQPGRGSSSYSAPSLIEAATDEEGRYEAVLWSEGAYSVIVRDSSGTPADSRDVVLSDPEETIDFTLAAEDIVGVVVDAEGRSIPDAGVALRWLVDAGVSHRLAKTAENGEFSFSIGDRKGLARLSAKKEGFGEATVELEVQRHEPPAPVRLVLPRLDIVSGTVLDASGYPLGGVWVASSGSSPHGAASVFGTAWTDSSGHFELTRAPSGVTRLFVSGPGCPLIAKDLPTNETAEPLEVRCPPAPAAIRIQIHHKDGTPASGRILLLRQNRTVIPRNVLLAHQQMLGLAASTDGSGRLTFVGLSPGTYDVYLSELTNSQAIALGRTEGHLAEVRLAALEAADIEVTVRSEEP
jgi:5-hydroxyisourate hydrolase-like protein (transthyretin family)